MINLGKVTLILLAAAGLYACEEQGPMEELGEDIDQAAEEMGQAVDDACENIKEGAGAEDTDC